MRVIKILLLLNLASCTFGFGQSSLIDYEYHVALFDKEHFFISLEDALNGPEKVFKVDFRLCRELTELPHDIFLFTILQSLDLGINKLKELPVEIRRLVNLQHLNLQVNKLEKLPPETGVLVDLKELIIFENQLKDLSSELYKLTNLKWLDLSNNYIKQLSSGVGKL